MTTGIWKWSQLQKMPTRPLIISGTSGGCGDHGCQYAWKDRTQMIAEMKDLMPDAAFIIMSGYQDFEYVKTASICAWQTTCSNRSIRVEMGNILEKIQRPNPATKPRVSQPFDSRWYLWGRVFGRYIAGRNSPWIGVKEKKALSARLTKFSAKSSTLYLRSRRRSHDWEGPSSHLIRSTFSSI